MSALKQVAQGFRNIWGHADDDEYSSDDHEAQGGDDSRDDYARETPREARDARSEKFTSPPSTFQTPPLSGGGNGGKARPVRPMTLPIRNSREKNIYTLKPKNIDEASLAADYLKTGSAVVLNLHEVEKVTAVRIIDFMSGVCYGLDHPGHAMKLDDVVFLFTPGDFEISSDETDYAENREFIFKEVANALPNGQQPPPTPTQTPTAATVSAYAAPERRSWER